MISEFNIFKISNVKFIVIKIKTRIVKPLIQYYAILNKLYPNDSG